jgi:anti-sigma B factor antagonist
MPGEEATVRRIGTSAVVTMPAEIDAMNADEIRHALLSAAGPGTAVVVVDMTETTFCDSAGVHAIISAHQHAAETGVELRLVATAVLRVFALVGADLLMPMYSTLGAALAGAPPAQAPGHS